MNNPFNMLVKLLGSRKLVLGEIIVELEPQEVMAMEAHTTECKKLIDQMRELELQMAELQLRAQRTKMMFIKKYKLGERPFMFDAETMSIREILSNHDE